MFVLMLLYFPFVAPCFLLKTVKNYKGFEGNSHTQKRANKYRLGGG